MKDKLQRLVRRVRVDMGYGPAEDWVTAKVIDERACQSLFGDGTTTDLLVELTGGERTWVSFWEEISAPNNDVLLAQTEIVIWEKVKRVLGLKRGGRDGRDK